MAFGPSFHLMKTSDRELKYQYKRECHSDLDRDFTNWQGEIFGGLTVLMGLS